MSLVARHFGEVYKYISTDIFKFCRMMNFQPTWQQEQLLGCVQQSQYDPGYLRLAVRSGKGPGKSTATAIVALWRSIKAVGAMTLLSAPTMRQCRDVWLAEARRLMQKADPILQRLIDVTQTKIVIAGNPDWGVKTVTANRVENALGYHEKNMTIICEEASGIPREIIQAFKDTATNPNCLFIQIGNPTNRDCSFFDCFNSQRDEWVGIRWNAEQTPKSEWFDPSRNDQVAREFGRDSDVYRIAVLGDFPLTDPNCVMGTEILQPLTDKARMRAAAVARRPDGTLPRFFGLDFARFGGDENTIFRRSGDAIVQWDRFAHIEPAEAVRTAFDWQKKAGWNNDDTVYVPDANGMGDGVMHMFYDDNKNVFEFKNQHRAFDSGRFDDRITEAYFNLAAKAKDGRGYIPDDPILLQQLTTRRYFLTLKGKIKIESKDEYMDRGHDSPDRADGLVQAMYDPAYADKRVAERVASSKYVGMDSYASRN